MKDESRTAGASKSRAAGRARSRAPLPVLLVVAWVALPSSAAAHGPVAPVASSYTARVSEAPGGLEVKVADGDQRMWLRAPAAETVVVLDYRGAPYLRFSSTGVQVNRNSAMYYLNQTPVAETPPPYLSATTPPSWQRASDGHEYSWHDGRLHALAAVALPAGVSFVGRWRVPVLVDGRLDAISGGLWHAGDPSLVWFWPIVVLIMCVLAARRVRRPWLDWQVARALATAALVAFALAGIGTELHGRPSIPTFQLVELLVILAFAAWGLHRVWLTGPGYFSFFLIAIAAIWEGGVLVSTLREGYVLVALPATLTRAATVVCLGCGAGLLLLVFRLAEHPEVSGTRSRPVVEELGGEDDSAWELV